MLRSLLVVALAFGLAGCAADEDHSAAAPLILDYTRMGSIVLTVAKLDFISNGPLQPGADESFFAEFKPKLADGAYRWGVDRLQAAGGQGRAVYSIDKASLTRHRLPVSSGWDSLFKREQAERWVAQLSVTLRVSDGPDRYSGQAGASVTRSTTLPESATPAEQENAYRRLLLGLLDDLNTQMTISIRTHLNAVTVAAP